MTASNRAEIKVIASNAVREACADLFPAFEAASAHTVASTWGGTLDITSRIAGGEVFDVVIVPAAHVDDLIAQGHLAAGGRVDLARSGIGVARHPEAPKPDISSGPALDAALMAARSIILSSGPSSFYLLDLFETMQSPDAIRAKIKRLAPGRSVGEALAHGHGDIGFTQISELLTIRGIDYLGPLPPDVQHYTVFAMGLHARAPTAEAAKALMVFLTSTPAAAALWHSGMEPAWG